MDTKHSMTISSDDIKTKLVKGNKTSVLVFLFLFTPRAFITFSHFELKEIPYQHRKDLFGTIKLARQGLAFLLHQKNIMMILDSEFL